MQNGKWCDQFSKWRAHTGLSQGEMGRLLGIHAKYVSRLECDTRHPSQALARFIEILQWMPYDLFRKLVDEIEDHRWDSEFVLAPLGVYAKDKETKP